MNLFPHGAIAIIAAAVLIMVLGVAYVEMGSHERRLRDCILRWEGRTVRYEHAVGCQVRDAVGWVPEKSFVVHGDPR